MTRPPVLVWFRRDLRLADHPALTAAVAAGAPADPGVRARPRDRGAGRRGEMAARPFARRPVEAAPRGGQRADPAPRPRARCAARARRAKPARRPSTGRGSMRPTWVARDKAVKAGLKADGIEAESHPGHLIHEPWAVETKAGGAFKVFTPFWRAIGPLGAPEPLPGARAAAGAGRLAGVRPARGLAARRGDEPRRGGRRALRRRGRGGGAATGWTRSSPRTSPATRRTATGRTCRRRRACRRTSPGARSRRAASGARAPARCEEGAAGAETFLKELTWREFAWHLLWHSPGLGPRELAPRLERLSLARRRPRRRALAARADRRADGRRRHARDVRDGHDAQPACGCSSRAT